MQNQTAYTKDHEIKITPLNLANMTAAEQTNLWQLHNEIQIKYGLFLENFQNPNDLMSHYQKNLSQNSYNRLFVIEGKKGAMGLIKQQKEADWGGKEQQVFTVITTDTTDFLTLSNQITETIQKYQEPNIECCLRTYNDEFTAFTGQLKGKIQKNSNKYTLEKTDIDLNLLDAWIKAGENKNPDLSLEFSYGVKEEHLEQYCSLFMETMQDMTDNGEPAFVPYVITPEIQRGPHPTSQPNPSHYCYMLFNKSKEMVAKSNVRVNGDYPYQFMIGVKRDYRGRGLGRWLYAAMYKKIYQEHSFKKLHLEHHPLNRSAIKLSVDTGYKIIYNEKKIVLAN